jgi:hypothetical protein
MLFTKNTMEEIMFLIFDNTEILNMDNVVSINMEDYSDNKVKIIIATTAIRYFLGDYLTSPAHYNSYCVELVIDNKKWFELLEAIQNDKKVFVL